MRGGLLVEIETLHLHRGYDHDAIRRLVTASGIDDLICSKRRPAATAKRSHRIPLGMRWPTDTHELVALQLRSAPPTPTASPTNAWLKSPWPSPSDHDQAHQVVGFP